MLKVEKSQGQINDEAILAALGYKQGKLFSWRDLKSERTIKFRKRFNIMMMMRNSVKER